MHDGDNQDLLGTGAVDQRIREPLETAPSNVLPDLWPQLREIANHANSGHNLIEEFVAQTGDFRVVMLDRVVEFLLRGRDKPRLHRAFRAAIISSSVTDAISPRS